MDSTPHVWFHPFEENNMKPLERLTHMKRIGLLLLAVAMATSAINAWSQASTGTDAARASQTAKEVRGATRTPKSRLSLHLC